MKLVLVCAFLFVATPMSLIAQGGAGEKGTEQKKPKFSQQGLLAGSVQGGYGNTQLGGWGGEATGGDKPPIGGSVSRDGRSWVVRVTNNSEENLRANFDVIQLDKNNKQIKRNPFSASLNAGEEVERTIKAHPVSQHCNLKITRWEKK